MKIFIWDARGLNDPKKQKEVKGMTNRLKADIFCHVDTRVKEANVGSVINRMVPGW